LVNGESEELLVVSGPCSLASTVVIPDVTLWISIKSAAVPKPSKSIAPDAIQTEKKRGSPGFNIALMAFWEDTKEHLAVCTLASLEGFICVILPLGNPLP
jgi:hypothetical protein